MGFLKNLLAGSAPKENLQPSTIIQLLEAYAGTAFEKQLHINEIIGEYDWNADMSRGEISFGTDLVFPMQVIGTFSKSAQTWLWAWANEKSGLSEQITRDAVDLKKYGERHNIGLLKESEFEFSREGMHRLGLIASGMFNASGYYLADYGQGVLLATIQSEAVDRSLKSDHLRILTVFPQLISQFEMNHHEALSHYVKAKGYDVSGSESRLTAAKDGNSIVAEFDPLGRMVKMNG